MPSSRGSSMNVTDSLARSKPSQPCSIPPASDAYPTPTSTPETFLPFSSRFPAAPAGSQPIPTSRNASLPTNGQLSTPPLTPESSFSGLAPDHSEFLTTIFPRSGLGAVPYAKTVKIASGAMDASWEGVVLALPGQPKTLYVNGKGAENVLLRESIVALMDLADEHLGCSAFVIALDKASPALGELLHSLMYVGGTVVTKPPFKLDPSFVLVGIEI